MGESCIFCKIIVGEIPAKKVFEDDWVLAIEDIKPSAPIHYLFMPKKHFRSLVELNLNDPNSEGKIYLEKIFAGITRTAKEKGISEKGFKTTINTGEQGGQTVFHLHAHLLGGGRLKNHVGHV